MDKKRIKILQWCVTILLSFIITALLYLNHMPAALLLGPMAAGIILGLKGFQLTIPKISFNLSQGVLGCLTAEAITANVLSDLLSYWPLAVIITLSTILISVAIGIFITRYSSLPGSTAIWGIMPGGASAMVAISGDYGGDMRLVALIQYLRVMMVVLMLAILSHFFSAPYDVTFVREIVWFPAPTLNLLLTFLIIIISLSIATIIKFPSGRVLIPMVMGSFLQISGFVQIETPQWLLALSFAIIGLSVGLRFNLPIIRLALKTLPIILLSIVAMMLFCYGQALLLHLYLDIDYLTSFLATSPGGLDTSVIIALDTRSDLAIILPLQILRLFSVLLFGPIIARYLSKNHLKAHK